MKKQKDKIEKIDRRTLEYNIVEAEGARIGVFDAIEFNKVVIKLNEIIEVVNQLKNKYEKTKKH